jgi:hypothetical protein
MKTPHHQYLDDEVGKCHLFSYAKASDEGSTVDQPPCQVTESERDNDAPTGQSLTTSCFSPGQGSILHLILMLYQYMSKSNLLICIANYTHHMHHSRGIMRLPLCVCASCEGHPGLGHRGVWRYMYMASYTDQVFSIMLVTTNLPTHTLLFTYIFVYTHICKSSNLTFVRKYAKILNIKR